MTGITLSSLALDSSRGLLYFTDPGNGTLGVLSIEVVNNSPNLLIAGATEKPTAIAVDSTNRYFTLITTYAYPLSREGICGPCLL